MTNFKVKRQSQAFPKFISFSSFFNSWKEEHQSPLLWTHLLPGGLFRGALPAWFSWHEVIPHELSLPAYIRCFLWPDTRHHLTEVYTDISSVKIQQSIQWKCDLGVSGTALIPYQRSADDHNFLTLRYSIFSLRFILFKFQCSTY